MIEKNFNPAFASALSLREKQIQQSYRPVIGVHKWFARRPGTLFRSLLLAEFDGPNEDKTYYRGHRFSGVIADPFMGGGTPLLEAARLGFHVVGADVNPMAYWIVRQSLSPLDLAAFRDTAAAVIADVEHDIGGFYGTTCLSCDGDATVKYFLWVKTITCPTCATSNDLFPGHLIAEAVRHPKNVVLCITCGELNEYDQIPTKAAPQRCTRCEATVSVEGNARKQRVTCSGCKGVVHFPSAVNGPLHHRLFALEYHCATCKPTHKGRFFKRPDAIDMRRLAEATALFAATESLPIPTDLIPAGDETDRLRRWGYTRFSEMFGHRQLLGLGLLLSRIRAVTDTSIREALLTVFSDTLRYQNLLCRYDTYALKCQDIFSVHGFPVGLVQCENNLLGIPRVGSGSFRHFIEKYIRAKQYCEQPFEIRRTGTRKVEIPTRGERMAAKLVSRFPKGTRVEGWLRAADSTTITLPPDSLDGVFTDPPYYDNVQYAELMDFCYAWLRLGVEDSSFAGRSTRHKNELTGNVTMGRGLPEFTTGLSAVFSKFAAALKPNAPFVFTYHHNAPSAYVPVIVALLDAGLQCTATPPAAAEMSASLHISGTKSSVLDSVFVCRRSSAVSMRDFNLLRILSEDAAMMADAGVRLTEGDLRCLASGHVARYATCVLHSTWDRTKRVEERIDAVQAKIAAVTEWLAYENAVASALFESASPKNRHAVSV